MKVMFKCGVLGMLLLAGSGAHASVPSSTDAFQSATITNFSGGAQAGASFDGSLSDPDNVTFFSTGGAGTQGFVEFSTGSDVTLNGIRLFAHSDGVENGNRRSMRAFRFFADTDHNGSFETELVNVAVDVDYGAAQVFTDADPTQSMLDATFMFGGSVTASNFRYVVDQGVSFGQFAGVRVQELDAIGAVPEPASMALLGLGLAGLGVSRRKKAS
jgi:hypothetical protein